RSYRSEGVPEQWRQDHFAQHFGGGNYERWRRFSVCCRCCSATFLVVLNQHRSHNSPLVRRSQHRLPLTSNLRTQPISNLQKFLRINLIRWWRRLPCIPIHSWARCWWRRLIPSNSSNFSSGSRRTRISKIRLWWMQSQNNLGIQAFRLWRLSLKW